MQSELLWTELELQHKRSSDRADCRGGRVVEEQTTGDGRRNHFRQHIGCCEIGFGHCRGRKSVASLDATPVFFGEQSNLRKQCCSERRNSVYGLRGVRVGEASNPGPPSDRQGVRRGTIVGSHFPAGSASSRHIVDTGGQRSSLGRGCVPCHQPSSTLWRTIWTTVQCPLSQQVLWQSVVWVEIALMLTVMDDPTVAPQLQDGQIVAGPTQCDSAVSMPAASAGASEDWCW